MEVAKVLVRYRINTRALAWYHVGRLRQFTRYASITMLTPRQRWDDLPITKRLKKHRTNLPIVVLKVDAIKSVPKRHSQSKTYVTTTKAKKERYHSPLPPPPSLPSRPKHKTKNTITKKTSPPTSSRSLPTVTV